MKHPDIDVLGVIDPNSDCPVGEDVLLDSVILVKTELDISGTQTIEGTGRVSIEGTTDGTEI